MQRGLQYLVCVSVCVCVHRSILAPRAITRQTRNTSNFSVTWAAKLKRRFVLKCFVRKLERYLLTVRNIRSFCGCGHAFASKRKAQCTTTESVKRKRASESEKETDKVRRARRTIKQTLHRQEQNRMHMASVRGSETCEQTLHRQEQNRMHMASVRGSETCEQTLHRQEQDRVHKASVRGSETPDQIMLIARMSICPINGEEVCRQNMLFLHFTVF